MANPNPNPNPLNLGGGRCSERSGNTFRRSVFRTFRVYLASLGGRGRERDREKIHSPSDQRAARGEARYTRLAS